MNAKYMAVFAAAIMLAGCTVLLVNADDADVDADSTVSKTVYVLNGQTAKVEIKTTESALGNYENTVSWSIPKGKDSPQKISDIATVYYTDVDYNGTYTLHFYGVKVGASSHTITYTVETDVTGNDQNDLTQTITYNFQINVLPSSFEATVEGTATNHQAVEDGLTIVYKGITQSNYYFYAIGLPDGLAMNTDGKIHGTPNVDSSEFSSVDSSKEYPVTIVATHIASNLTISYTVDITVNGSPYAFSYFVTGDAIKVADNIYKIVRGQEFYIHTEVGAGDPDYESIDSVVYVDDEGTQKPITSVNGIYALGSVVGTGSYTVVMTNGDQEQSFRIIVVEPLADVDASIGFAPGVGHWYDSTE